MNVLDPETCRRARLSRDPRFDGQFFLAVRTTGIYCRPICPARPPREKNVRYYRSAAEAAQAGYRPCLRCRPESAPMSPAWLGTETTLKRALTLITEGYLNAHSLGQLADRLGVGERYLRKLFRDKLGVAPTTVAQTQRLHFAQKLLLETTLPITQVAFASGFGSVRRFNSATRAAFGCAAGELRRRPAAPGETGIVMTLSYRPPYDWQGVANFFNRHAVAGIESFDNGVYRRHLQTEHGVAVLRVTLAPPEGRHMLRLELKLSDNRDLMPTVARLQRMFDLDAQPADIADRLAGDAALQELLERYPGIRSPVFASPFEACVRAVLGQQVSTQAARRLCADIVAAADLRVDGNGESLLVFPTPASLANLPDGVLRMPGSRRRTLRAVCECFAGVDAADAATVLGELAAIKGIGPWTLTLLAMRGYGQTDCFPHTDLGIARAAENIGIPAGNELQRRSAAWQPWRSYAANLLWRSLSDG
jgi:AraC family transcriptional regulator of adaptative response / DNA-3-methyladenine glycosylase II